MSLLVSLGSETLKLKRTLSLYLCVLAAIFGPFMSFLEYLNLPANAPQGLPWTEHFMKGREPFSIALLPFYVILISTLLTHIEYRDHAWKQVFSSPQKKINIFMAKFLTLQLMIVLFLIGYNMFLVLAAIFAELLHPGLYNGKLDFAMLLRLNAQSYYLVLGVSAIQFWLSLRFKNFIAPLAIGVAAWLLAPMMIFQFRWSIVEQYPYAFTMLGVIPDYKNNVVLYQWYSIMTAVIFLSLGFIEFTKRKKHI